MPISSAILSALLSLSPLTAPRETLPGWVETSEARAFRYASIADDVAAAVTDACSARTDVAACQRSAAALLIGIAWHESEFAPDVDLGPCYRGADGKGARCDAGRAASVWQLHGSADEREMWQSDRKQAARVALRRAWRSMGACRGGAEDERLAAYAGGVCANATARKRARELAAAVARAARAMASAP